jgi:predicted nucleotidyltransferase
MRTEIPSPTKQLDEFCRRWKITELRVFGSALRDDFRPDSDLDLLVTFAPDADWSLLNHVAMEEELSGIVGRKVDLVSQRAIERCSNWIRRKAVLESAEPWWETERCR